MSGKTNVVLRCMMEEIGKTYVKAESIMGTAEVMMRTIICFPGFVTSTIKNVRSAGRGKIKF